MIATLGNGNLLQRKVPAAQLHKLDAVYNNVVEVVTL